MGLDMYLTGRKHLWRNYDKPEENREENGFPLETVTLSVGYWRKHPDLHGYIVQQYGGGKDDCQEIDLSADALRDIRRAVEQNKLPHTEGFFFGNSGSLWLEGEGRQFTLNTLHKAEEWLASGDERKELRAIIYQASW